MVRRTRIPTASRANMEAGFSLPIWQPSGLGSVLSDTFVGKFLSKGLCFSIWPFPLKHRITDEYTLINGKKMERDGTGWEAEVGELIEARKDCWEGDQKDV